MRRVEPVRGATHEAPEAAGEEPQPFEYWVNVYAGFIDMGGRTREDADTFDRELWQMPGEEPQPRLACRLVRYTPGKGLTDVTPKPEGRKHAMSLENRAKAAERMRQYHRRKRAGQG